MSLKSLSRYLRHLPFRLGFHSLWPGTYLSSIPDRYSINRWRYRAGGGSIDDADAELFVRSNPLNNRGDLSRYYFLSLVIDQIQREGIRGDVAELGVYTGSTAVLMAKLARLLGVTTYLLDTFEGFDDGELGPRDRPKAALFSETSVGRVRDLIGDSNIRFVKGHFPESAAAIDPAATFSLVHIDCDVYRPYLAGLEYFYPRLVPGGFLVMHDYSSLHWEGAAKAVDEFFADKPERPVPIPDKSGTAVIRKVHLP